MKERRYGGVHLPLFFSVSLICILILCGIHGFNTYDWYGGVAAPEGRIDLLIVWIGVVVSSISLLAQFCCAIQGKLPPIAFILINAPIAVGWIGIDVYWWFGGTRSRHCNFSSSADTVCEYNALALIEFSFMCVLTIFTIYASIVGFIKRQRKSSTPINAQEVQVLLHERAASSTTSTPSNLTPLKSPFTAASSIYENSIPDRVARVSHGPSIESYTEYTGGATDPFDSKLQRLGLRRYSTFDNQGSQSDCVIATVAWLMGYQRVNDLYEKLRSMRGPGNGHVPAREELYDCAIYYLLKQHTEDKIFNELVSKRQVLSCVGTRNSPLMGNDWDLNRLGVVYNRPTGIGDCFVLQKAPKGTWEVAEVQMAELPSRRASGEHGSGKIDEFRVNAADPVLLFAIYASEDASRSALTGEARRAQNEYRSLSLTTSISTLGTARAASPVMTDVSMVPSTMISSIVPAPLNPNPNLHTPPPPQSPFRQQHPRFCSRYSDPSLDDERLAMLYNYDRTRADAVSTEYNGLADEYSSIAAHDVRFAGQDPAWASREQGLQMAQRMHGIAARIVSLRRTVLERFGHLLDNEESVARARAEASQWEDVVSGVSGEVERRQELLNLARQQGPQPSQYHRQIQQQPHHQQQQQHSPPPQQRAQVSRFREVDLGEPQSELHRSELEEAAGGASFAARMGVGPRAYQPLRQQEAEGWRGQRPDHEVSEVGIGQRSPGTGPGQGPGPGMGMMAHLGQGRPRQGRPGDYQIISQ